MRMYFAAARPSAPSPQTRRELELVKFVGEEAWPSPELSRIETQNYDEDFSSSVVSKRVRVLSQIGDLLDTGLLSESHTGILLDLLLRGELVSGISDLLASRKTPAGKAQFLKVFLTVYASKPPQHFGYSTPVPSYHEWQLPPPTPFVDLPHSMTRSASPPLRLPTALRPPPGSSVKLGSICENLARTISVEDPKLSPESFKSTNAGSSVDSSSVSPPSGTLTASLSNPNLNNTSPTRATCAP